MTLRNRYARRAAERRAKKPTETPPPDWTWLVALGLLIVIAIYGRIARDFTHGRGMGPGALIISGIIIVGVGVLIGVIVVGSRRRERRRR